MFKFSLDDSTGLNLYLFINCVFVFYLCICICVFVFSLKETRQSLADSAVLNVSSGSFPPLIEMLRAQERSQLDKI